ncbi:MAG: hypothetical protein AAF471_04125 [Myxococcota bacterium]
MRKDADGKGNVGSGMRRLDGALTSSHNVTRPRQSAVKPAHTKALIFLGLCSCTLDNRASLPPDLKPINNAVLTPCTPAPNDKPRSCLVLTSAQKQRLWVVDAVTGDLVPADRNRFFPLTVLLNTFPSRLTASPELPFVLVLDGPRRRLAPIHVRGPDAFVTKPPAFTTTGNNPGDVALVWRGAGAGRTPSALVTLPQQGQVQVLPLAARTGLLQTDAATFAITVGSEAQPHRIAVDTRNRFAVMTDRGDTKVHILDLNTLEDDNPLIQSVDVSHTAGRLTVGRMRLQNSGFPQAVALVAGPTNSAAAGSTLTLIGLENSNGPAVIGRGSVPDFVRAIHVPNGNSPPCCGQEQGKAQPWVVALTANGKLLYLTRDGSGLHVSDETILSDKTRLGGAAVQPVEVVGGALTQPPDKEIDNISGENASKKTGTRKLFFVFQGLIATAAEGENKARRL